MQHKALPLSIVDLYVPLARKLGVSQVARSKFGFLAAYRKVGGKIERMSEMWQRKRSGFIARHKTQALRNDEPLWLYDGLPTRRHLAMIMWAWSPASQAELRRRAKIMRGDER